LVATQYSTKEAAKAIEYSDEAVAILANEFGKDMVSNLYNASEGASLT
jgi:hypothetical protein